MHSLLRLRRVCFLFGVQPHLCDTSCQLLPHVHVRMRRGTLLDVAACWGGNWNVLPMLETVQRCMAYFFFVHGDVVCVSVAHTMRTP